MALICVDQFMHLPFTSFKLFTLLVQCFTHDTWIIYIYIYTNKLNIYNQSYWFTIYRNLCICDMRSLYTKYSFFWCWWSVLFLYYTFKYSLSESEREREGGRGDARWTCTDVGTHMWTWGRLVDIYGRGDAPWAQVRTWDALWAPVWTRRRTFDMYGRGDITVNFFHCKQRIEYG